MSEEKKIPVVPKEYLLPFILTTICFSLWGFANDFTNPLVKVFEQVFIITTGQASWLQFAFYTGYFCMALPAVLFIRRFSYKSAIMIGLTLYAGGALITIPASLTAQFALFCLASYVITYGLAFLETACNPYILAMGPPETATQRLNLAQSFNPIGSLIGMTVASMILAPSLLVTEIRGQIKEEQPEQIQYLITNEAELPAGAVINAEETQVTLADGSVVDFYKEGLPDFKTTSGALDGAMPNVLKAMRAYAPEEFKTVQQADLANVRGPYMVIAGIVFIFLCIFAVSKMPAFRKKDQEKDAPFWEIFSVLCHRARFVEGVLAQLFYVGAQIMCWTFIIHYGMEQVGLSLSEAQGYNIIAMIIFVSSRFICTFLMRYIRPSAMLLTFAIGGFCFTAGAIYLPGMTGLWSLVMISACMSLMFPTIYGIALNGLKIEEAKLGSAFLIMSIVGGAVLTKLQGAVITDFGVRTSFWLPAGCFVLIALYGLRCILAHDKSRV
ncbi:sugar MFS transporter [Pontiella agarivorans]|uniref:Sugar MFS transporter n=1 Tax=Pontiella agarivorans TaxID=3038953 RepID=A0ABU5MT12_9BACT|nr:sugar MFS transporter [Pontiella agarivorans]MDZ8117349.1 sugar MFS transporter [Pontiella agarivorans]